MDLSFLSSNTYVLRNTDCIFKKQKTTQLPQLKQQVFFRLEFRWTTLRRDKRPS